MEKKGQLESVLLETKTAVWIGWNKTHVLLEHSHRRVHTRHAHARWPILRLRLFVFAFFTSKKIVAERESVAIRTRTSYRTQLLLIAIPFSIHFPPPFPILETLPSCLRIPFSTKNELHRLESYFHRGQIGTEPGTGGTPLRRKGFHPCLPISRVFAIILRYGRSRIEGGFHSKNIHSTQEKRERH